MRKIIFTALLTLLTVCSFGQARETVAILGDSYSTFEGYLTPDTMKTWYYKGVTNNRTDVTKVTQPGGGRW